MKKLLVVWVVMAMTGVAQAAISPVALWRFGEEDSAPVVGNPLNNPTKDLVGGFDIASGDWHGSTPVYSNTTPGAFSSLSALTSAGGNEAATLADVGVTPGFGNDMTTGKGVDFWFMFPNDPTTENGGGLGQLFSFGNNHQDLIDIRVVASDPVKLQLAVYNTAGPNPATGDGPSVEQGAWYHVAGVFDSDGDVKLYVNGTTPVATVSATPHQFNASDGYIMTWGMANRVTHMDELRIFTFDGAFNPEDVFAGGDDGGAVPEPATLALLGLGAIGLLLRRRA